MNRKEQSLATSIVAYIKLQYPKIIFKIDGGADANKSSHIARGVYSKQQYKRGYPDLQIIHNNGRYNGLFMELKADLSCLFNKNGTLQRGSNDHIVEQYDFIKELRSAGYWADFVYNFDSAKTLIDCYVNGGDYEMMDYKFHSLTIAEKKESEAKVFFSNWGL